jgi:hypothetical protein
MKNENSAAIAEELGRAEILGNSELVEQFPTLVNNTTRNQMAKAFVKYVTGIKWIYLGDKSQAEDAKSSFNLLIE